MSSGSNTFYGTSAPKPVPKPPPRKNPSTTSGTTTAATRRANAKLSSRSTYQSNRSVPPAKPSAPSSGNASKPTMKPATKLNKPSSSFGSSGMRARKAPAASRPVGSYYNSSASSTTMSSTNESSTTTSSNLYGASSVPASTTTTSDVDDTWDDWGSPAKPTAPAPAVATSNPHASWAAPAAAASTSTTTDWYSAGGTSSTTSNYTSSGFGNQSTQQQQQPQANAAPMQPGSGFFQNNTTQQQQQQQQPSFLSGAMDSSAPTMMSNQNPNNSTSAPAAPFNMSAINMFMPSSVMTPQQPTADSQYPSIEDEAPLLEELGINIPHMMLKSKAVIVPFSRFGGDKIDPVAICKDGDLPGPVIIAVALGGEMVLTGKLQFGYIYVYGLFGCIAMTLVVNLMSPAEAISFWTVTSIMGYALLPVNILAFVKIFVVNLIKMQTLGNILGGLTVLWSTFASTRLLELGCGLRAQRYLIMYPLLLFYSAFVMMTIL